MPDSFERWILQVMAGQTRGVAAASTRAALAMLEPAYAAVMAARNRAFDRGQRAIQRLPRPVISVGNLTTGGTGKTPAVQWLVRVLQGLGYRPGVLLRGYRKATGDCLSDEEQLLRESLRVPIVANADRVAGGLAMLRTHPDISVIVLDDGFQHRRVARDLDVVLIDATQPFGFDHILPRGLLREPVSGLSRAGVVIVTRVDQVTPAARDAITERARRFTNAPILQSTHQLTDVIDSKNRSLALAEFRGKRVLALSAIGNPTAFERSLGDAGLIVASAQRFGDHHAYNETDLVAIFRAAREVTAGWILTTEKDWVKLRTLNSLEAVRETVESSEIDPLRVVRVRVQLMMSSANEQAVVDVVTKSITS